MADLIAVGYPDAAAAEAAAEEGGTVLKTSLSKDDEHELQDAWPGQPAAQEST
jgi:uncharacterized membrane protein